VYVETVTPSLAAERTAAWVLSAFVVGIALAAVLAGRTFAFRDPARARRIGAAVFAGGLVVGLVAGRADEVSPGLGNLLAALAAAALLGAPLVLESSGAGAWRLFDNRVMRWAGSRAYGLFLWHFLVMSELYPLFDGLESYWVSLALLLPAVLVATGLVAEVSWRLVERPALRLRRWRREPAAVRNLRPEVAPVSGHAG
jgi:peptidoglycan/LPS O-acetylase OafA/YrhL